MFYINEDSKDKYDYEFNKINTYINNNFLDKKKTEINIIDIKIDDIIYIEFMSDSQKYIYDLYPKFGKIINIINDDIIIKNLNNDEERLLHDNLSYYGNSLGYSFNIYKFI